MIYFDVTRILGRVSAPSPTGIDRVEFEYAKYCLAEGAFFVAQLGDNLVGVPAWLVRRVVANCEGRWFFGRELDSSLSTVLENWKKRARPKQQTSNLLKFFNKLRGKRFSDRLSIVKTERKYISAKVTPIFADVAIFSVAFAPKLFERILCPKDTAKDSVIKFNRISNKVTYINVGHTGLEKSNLWRKLKSLPQHKIIFYVHDLLPISHPHLFVEGEKEKHRRRMDNVIKYSDSILANSAFTECEIKRLYKGAKVDGVLEIGTPSRAEIGLENFRGGFVAIGTVEPRKNLLWLATSWQQFCLAHSELVGDEKLTIYGKIGWLSERDKKAFFRAVESSANIEFISGASDEEIRHRLCTARAYVTAAEVEGWGMPLAESLALGTPVVATNVPAHREVTQGFARFFAHNNVEDFKSIIKSCYDDENLSEMVVTTTKFKPWTWESHFKRLDSIVARV